MDNEKLTWHQLYKVICKELDIIFPLYASELSVRLNDIPDDILLYCKRNASKQEINEETTAIANAYFRLVKTVTYEKFQQLMLAKDICKLQCVNYPERIITASTLLSCWYLSGYRGMELYNKFYNYLVS